MNHAACRVGRATVCLLLSAFEFRDSHTMPVRHNRRYEGGSLQQSRHLLAATSAAR